MNPCEALCGTPTSEKLDTDHDKDLPLRKLQRSCPQGDSAFVASGGRMTIQREWPSEKNRCKAMCPDGKIRCPQPIWRFDRCYYHAKFERSEPKSLLSLVEA